MFCRSIAAARTRPLEGGGEGGEGQRHHQSPLDGYSCLVFCKHTFCGSSYHSLVMEGGREGKGRESERDREGGREREGK